MWRWCCRVSVGLLACLSCRLNVGWDAKRRVRVNEWLAEERV